MGFGIEGTPETGSAEGRGRGPLDDRIDGSGSDGKLESGRCKVKNILQIIYTELKGN